MSPFPLLNVPRVVIREIIDFIPICDLIALSLCSQRMFNMIKYNVKKSRTNQMRMYTIVWSDTAAVLIESDKGLNRMFTVYPMSELPNFMKFRKNTTGVEDSEETRQSSIIGGYKVPTYGNLAMTTWLTFWEDPKIGIRKTFDHVSHLFSLNFHTLQIEKNDSWAIDWANSIVADRIPKLIVKSDKVFSNEEFKHILTTTTAKSLEIRASPSETFKFHNFSEIKCDRLLISPAFWVEMDHIISSNFVEIEIEKSNFKSREINRLLEHWIYGGYENLKFLSIECDEPIEISDENSRRLRRTDDEKHFESPSGVKHMFKGWEIQQRKIEGGKIASISFKNQFDSDMLVMGIW